MRASDVVYRTLREQIISGELAPGAVLGEVEQATRLGVSRTPLREGLRRLEAEGLTVAGKGRTLMVSDLSADDVTHLFELREPLECQAARLAAQRRRPARFIELAQRFGVAPDEISATAPDRAAYYARVAELDEAIDEAMSSPHLLRALGALRSHVARARRLSSEDTRRLVQAAHEHRLIAQAVADGDATLAAQAVAVHLHASLATILTALTERNRGTTVPHHVDAT